MQRLNDDRGAVAVVVAILMVPLLGMAALSLDVAALYSERQQLQIGADAAALAVAQDCSDDNCGYASQTARDFVALNSDTPETDVSLNPNLSPATGQVTVTASGTRQHWFAPVLGIDESDISTKATAGWGYPSGGTSFLPLTFAKCEYEKRTGDGTSSEPDVIILPKKSDEGCLDPNRNPVPGGFGWLKTDSGTCTATTEVDGDAGSDPGKSVPNACSAEDFDDLLDSTLLLPIFDEHGGQGNNAWYRIYGYAAFHVTGYFFSNKYSSPDPPCSQPQQCIEGYFTGFTERVEGFEYGPDAPDLGASAVYLLPNQ